MSRLKSFDSDKVINDKRFICAISVITFFIILIVVWAPYPKLITYWEGSTIFFQLMGGAAAKIRLIIKTGANVGGMYKEIGYPMLNAFHNIIDFFNLDYSLYNIRILPRIYSSTAIFLFFVIMRRFVGLHIGILITLLFAINPIFVVFQRLLIPISLTIMCMLFIMERFQKYNFHMKNHITIITISYGFALALTALNYSVGRLYLLSLMLFQAYILSINIYKGRFTKKDALSALGVIAALLLILRMFSSKNLPAFFATSFLIPSSGEISLMRDQGQSHAFFINLWHYISCYIFPNKLFSISTNSANGEPYLIAPMLVSLLSTVGFIANLKNLKKMKLQWPYYSFVVLIIAPFFFNDHHIGGVNFKPLSANFFDYYHFSLCRSWNEVSYEPLKTPLY